MFASPVPAGGAVLNGAGECTGFLAAAEWGLAETPVFLTSTMQVGRVYDAACELLMSEDSGIGADDVIIPIVAECDDSFLSDARRMQVSAADVGVARQAAAAAGAAGGAGRRRPRAPSGAGTGMSCLGFKGGIGTSSRLVPSGHTVGVLVLSNFGEQQRLTSRWRAGGPAPAARRGDAGRRLAARPPAGSCITVIVTDAPLDSAACSRLARRAGLGLARTGSTAHHGSGEIFLALATGLRSPRGEAVPPQVVRGSPGRPWTRSSTRRWRRLRRPCSTACWLPRQSPAGTGTPRRACRRPGTRAARGAGRSPIAVR